MSYRNLEVWKTSRQLVIEIHMMSLTLLKLEIYEEGQQIRRSSKSVKSTIVEGYGRRRYKNEYLKFMVYAQASNDETTDHLETLYETGSLKDEKTFNDIMNQLTRLGKMLNAFIQAIEREHVSIK